MDLGALQGAAEIYVGVLAATILFIATNAGMIGVSRLTYSMGQYRQLPERPARAAPAASARPYVAIMVFGLVACVAILPGPGRLPRHDLRLRRDAVVHDRAPRGDRAAAQAARRASGRGAAPARCASRGRELPLFAVFGGLGTGDRLRRGDRARRRGADRGRRSGWRSGSRPTWSTAGARGCRSRRRTRSCCRSRRSSTRSSTSRCWWRSRTATTRPRRSPRRRGWRRGGGAASTCS